MSRSESPVLFSCPESCLVQCQARARQKVIQGKAWMLALECPKLGGILIGKGLEQLLGQEILEEDGTCLMHTQGQQLNLSPGHQMTSKGGGDAQGELEAVCHQCPLAEVARWPPRSHTATPGYGMGTSRWCLLFQQEDPIATFHRHWEWSNLSPNWP